MTSPGVQNLTLQQQYAALYSAFHPEQSSPQTLKPPSPKFNMAPKIAMALYQRANVKFTQEPHEQISVQAPDEQTIGEDAPEINEHDKLEKMLGDLRKKKGMQKLAYESGIDPLLDRYNTITFKQPPKSKQSKKDKMFSSTAGKGNSVYTDKEIFQKVQVVKNPHDYDSEEKLFNFKHSNTSHQQQRKNSKSPSLGGGFKVIKKGVEASTTTGGDPITRAPSTAAGNNAYNFNFQNANSNNLRMSQTVQGFWNSKSSQNSPVPPTAPSIGVQSLIEKGQMRTRQLVLQNRQNTIDDADTLKRGATAYKNHSMSETKLVHDINPGAAFSPAVMTNLLQNHAAKKNNLIPTPQSKITLQPIEKPTTGGGKDSGPANGLSWVEEQRLKKIIRDCEKFDMSLTLSNEDAYLKFKAQLNFLKSTGMSALKLTSPSEVSTMFDSGLSTMLLYVDQIQFQRQNEQRMAEIEREKIANQIADYDKQIDELKIQAITEENLQRMFAEAKKKSDLKKAEIDKKIKKLFETDALACQTIEWPAMLEMTEEEKDTEDELRGMNQRRMVWLHNDLEMMTRLIMGDVADSMFTTLNGYTDILLQTDSQDLKISVAQGIQNQIAKFHLQVEEVLKENQRLLKLREPQTHDRYIQTDVWSMEHYLEEMEVLKRRKWLTDKENKEMKEVVTDLREKIKRLKEDNRRYLKKTGEMRDRERTQENTMQEQFQQINQLKRDLEAKQRESDGKVVVSQKEIKGLKELIDKINNEKVQREVDIMKREEEVKKQVEFMMGKEREGRVAITFLQKQIANKDEELKNLQKTYLELKNRPVFNPTLYKLQNKQVAPPQQSESDSESSLSSDNESLPEIKADLNTGSKNFKDGVGPIGKAKKGKKLIKAPLPPSGKAEQLKKQQPPSPSVGSSLSKNDTSMVASQQKGLGAIPQSISQSDLKSMGNPLLHESDQREIASQAEQSQHRTSESSKRSRQKDATAQNDPISIHVSGTALEELGRSPQSIAKSPIEDTILQQQTPEKEEVPIANENDMAPERNEIELIPEGDTMHKPSSSMHEQLALSKQVTEEQFEQSRPETQPTEKSRSRGHRSSKQHSSKKGSKKHSQMHIDGEGDIDIAPLELRQEEILVENEQEEEQDTIEPLHVPAIKHQKTRKSRKSTSTKQVSQRRMASMVQAPDSALYGGSSEEFAHQYSIKRMITPGFTEMDAMTLNNGGESPSQNRLFPQYTRDDLEAMLLSYQHNRQEYVEWKEHHKLTTTEEVAIQCGDFDIRGSTENWASAHQTNKVQVSSSTQTTGQDILDATTVGKVSHPRVSKFEEFKKHVVLTNSQKSLSQVPRASNAHHTLAPNMRREIVVVNIVNSAAKSESDQKRPSSNNVEAGQKKVQFRASSSNNNKDLDQQIHNNLDILHRLDSNLTAMQQLNDGKKLTPQRPSKAVPRASKAAGLTQSHSPARTSSTEPDVKVVEPTTEKKRNPFDRTCIVEGAEESDDEVKEPPPPVVEPPPEKTLVMLNAADLARKKQQTKQKKEQDIKINQLVNNAKPNRIEKQLESMLQQQKDYEKRKEEEKKKEEEKGPADDKTPAKANLLTPTKLTQKRKTEAPSSIKIEHGHIVADGSQKLGKDSSLEMVGVHSTSKKSRKSTLKKKNTKKAGDGTNQEEGGAAGEDPDDQESGEENNEQGWTARDHGPQLQDVNLMEYYETMRPEKPFNALVVGHVAPIYMIKTYVDGPNGDPNEPQNQLNTTQDRELGDYHQELQNYQNEKTRYDQ